MLFQLGLKGNVYSGRINRNRKGQIVKYYRCATEAPLTIHRACALGANDLPQLFKRNKLHQLISLKNRLPILWFQLIDEFHEKGIDSDLAYLSLCKFPLDFNYAK
jgi:hypothetical protein